MRIEFKGKYNGISEYVLKTIHGDYIISERELLILKEDITDALIISKNKKS